jgi:LacI family transcriptional regulator
MNNKGEISADTRERVLAAARELGYRPSGIARGLKMNRTGTLGLVVPDIANPFFAETARGASETATREGYTVLLCNTDEHPEREAAILRQLEAHRVDGIVLVSSRQSDAQLERAISDWMPAVLINRELTPRPGRGCVITNERQAMHVAVRHLLDRGHRAIGLVGCTSHSRSGQERRLGYREAGQRWGLSLAAGWCTECAPTVDGGRQAASRLLQEQPELTALLCYNDLVAVGAVQACRALGRRVPEDCALVGWDDIPLARFLSPPLTTLDMPKYLGAAQAVATLVRMIRDETHVPAVITLNAELVVRQST